MTIQQSACSIHKHLSGLFLHTCIFFSFISLSRSHSLSHSLSLSLSLSPSSSSQDSKPLGSIRLKDLTVTALDDTSSPTLPAPPTSGSDTLPAGSGCIPVKSRQRNKPKVNRFLLITANGVRHELQAANAEEREVWLSQLKIASKLA